MSAGAALSVLAVVGVVLYAPNINAASAWRGLAWGIPAAALVASALGVGTPETSRPARAATRLGDASSLYLVHSALFILVFYLASPVVDLRRVDPAAFLLVASVGSALALFRWFEAPVIRRLQALVAPSAPRGPRQKPGWRRSG